MWEKRYIDRLILGLIFDLFSNLFIFQSRIQVSLCTEQNLQTDSQRVNQRTYPRSFSNAF